MFITDGINPYGMGLGYKPTKYNMVGGMANYDKNKNLVSQYINDKGEMKNYDLTLENIYNILFNSGDNIISPSEKNILEEEFYKLFDTNNESKIEYGKLEDDKLDKLKTEYIELLSLKEANDDRNQKDERIDNLIKGIENIFIKNNEKTENKYFGKKERDSVKEKIKVMNKDINPIYEEAENMIDEKKLSNELWKIIRNDKSVDDINNNNELDNFITNILGDDESFLNDMYKIIHDNIGDKKNIISNFEKFLGDIKHLLRGNYSEDIILNVENPDKNKDLLLKIITNDNTSIYNSKNDNAYKSDLFPNIKNFLKDRNVDFTDSQFNKIIKENFKKFFPYDGISDKALYELKSRDKNIYDASNESKYSLSKLYGNNDNSRYIGFKNGIDNYKLYIKNENEFDKNNKIIKNISTRLFLFKNINGKDIQVGEPDSFDTLKPGNRDLLWSDVNNKGIISLDPTYKLKSDKKINSESLSFPYKKGIISTPIQNKLGKLNEKEFVNRRKYNI